MINLTLQKQLNGVNGPLQLDVNLDIEKGAFISIYGLSGSGKTSVLRMIAGLMSPDKGSIQVADEVWFDAAKSIDKAPQKRNVGFVFQDYTLFPNMNVEGQLKYALRKEDDPSVVDELLEIMDIGQLKSTYPRTLSGGQKQRVALARALVQKPSLLLLDEPFSALDRGMRSRLQDYVLQAHKVFGLTTIMVSHDVAEIYKMSDQTIVLEEGRVAKQGKPQGVFANHEVSGKFQFTGEVVSIEEQGFLLIIFILIGSDFVKVIGSRDEVGPLKVGDRVMVASKAFNPIVKIINP